MTFIKVGEKFINLENVQGIYTDRPEGTVNDGICIWFNLNDSSPAYEDILPFDKPYEALLAWLNAGMPIVGVTLQKTCFDVDEWYREQTKSK